MCDCDWKFQFVANHKVLYFGYLVVWLISVDIFSIAYLLQTRHLKFHSTVRMKIFSFEILPDKEKITFHWDESNGEIVFVTESNFSWRVECFKEILCSWCSLLNVPPLNAMCETRKLCTFILDSFTSGKHSSPSSSGTYSKITFTTLTNCESISSVREFLRTWLITLSAVSQSIVIFRRHGNVAGCLVTERWEFIHLVNFQRYRDLKKENTENGNFGQWRQVSLIRHERRKRWLELFGWSSRGRANEDKCQRISYLKSFLCSVIVTSTFISSFYSSHFFWNSRTLYVLFYLLPYK